MLHYHGTPITPRSVLYELAGSHFCVSFAEPRDVKVCHQIGQSVMLDNGAFTAWTLGRRVDWDAWAEWAEEWLAYPTTWAVAPDVIDGTEEENDELLRQYWDLPLAPVWHLHESLGRLKRLRDRYGRICFGSSGQYEVIGSVAWRRRVGEAFDAITDNRGRVGWVHMLRGMSLVGDIYPFASTDSTDVARNHNRPQNTARQLVERWDAVQCPARWSGVNQLELEAV